jgi:hypothetical protein
MSRFCLLHFPRFSRAADSQWNSCLRGLISAYSDIVVASGGCKATLAVGLKVSRVDGRIVVVP